MAVLTLAILCDLTAQLLKRWSWSHIAVTALYAVGTIAAVVAFLTGRAAADSVDVPAAANAVLTDHANLGELTMWFFLIYVGLRLALLRFASRYITLPLFLVALVGFYVLWQTANHGGELVYAYGSGVRQKESAANERHDRNDGIADTTGKRSELMRTGESSWKWNPTSVSLSGVQWLEGSADEVRAVLIEGSGGETAIRIAVSDTPHSFTLGDTMESVQIDATVNLDSLDGSLTLLHNVRADGNGFFSIENGVATLGQTRGGKGVILEKEKTTTQGTVRLRLIADRTHFLGYVNGKLVVHGHGDAFDAPNWFMIMASRPAGESLPIRASLR